MIRNGPKRTIFTHRGLGLLQIASELDTRWCASEDTGPKGVDCEIPHRLERRTKYYL